MLSRRSLLVLTSATLIARTMRAQYGVKPCEFAPATGVMEIRNFSKYEITQGPDQCWSACIRMFLGYFGVQLSQSQLATIVKGSSDIVESATAEEIQQALSRRLGRFQDENTGEPWNLDFIAIPGAVPSVMYRYLCEQRPILAVLESKKHVVVIYRANFEASGQDLSFKTLIYYDPGLDKDVELDASDVSSQIGSLWLLTASRPSQNVF